jgi:hypothetical protein
VCTNVPYFRDDRFWKTEKNTENAGAKRKERIWQTAKNNLPIEIYFLVIRTMKKI